MSTITITSPYYTDAILTKFSETVYWGNVKCSGKNAKKSHKAFYYPATGKFVVQEGMKNVVVLKDFFTVL